MLFFKTKKPTLTETRSAYQDNIDLQIINRMNQEFAISLDLNETLNTALKVIVTRLNAQAANIFLINNKTKKFECIASLNQDYLDEYQLDLKDGVMGKAIEQRKCIRVGNVRKDIREIAEFYFDLDNKTNFTTYSVLCAPLIAANDCIGVIHCLNKKTNDKLFIEDDRKLLELLSTPATSNQRGWYIKLDNFAKVSAEPTVYAGRVYFPVYEPNEDDRCAVGTAYICAVDDECGFNKSVDEIGALDTGENVNKCKSVGTGILSRVIVFANKLFANISGSAPNEEDLISINTGVLDAESVRDSWRENY